VMPDKAFDWTTTSIDLRGVLRVIENRDLPFSPARIFFVTDVPKNTSRGAHAHIACHQILFVVTGSLNCKIIDRKGERISFLSPDTGFIHLPPGTWAEQFDFEVGTVMGCLASEPYDSADYIHQLDVFLDQLN
jgi:UDP-2-acetamido-3-amino-2,3-dideoxy-glucuronate N-acetyltransferase